MSFKILVIDHDPDSFEEMMRPLIGAGYEVVLATDADQGLDTFERMQPDLTMIEAFLPQRTGPQVCRQLRQTESGQSTPIVLIHDTDRGEEARQSLDGCDCNQIIDRPITDEHLLEMCQRLLPAEDVAEAPVAESPAVEATASTKAASADPNTFLNNEQLGDALGRLNLIIDGEADKPERQKVPGVAEQRGDFSYIAEELKAVEDAPAVAEVHDDPVAAASEEPQPGPSAAPAEMAKLSPPPSATTPPAGLSETMVTDDLGDDISAHLDTLFGGGETTSPASDQESAASADAPATAESAAPTSPAPAGTAPQTLTHPEPPMEAAAPPAPAAARPVPPRVAQSQTEAAVPTPARKTAPAAVKAATPHQAPAGRSKIWLAAASIAVVILGGAFALYFMRGSSPDPVAAIPDTPAQDSSGSQTIASAGLPTREVPPSLPVTLPQPADATDSKDSLVDPGASPAAGPSEPKPDQPPVAQTNPKPQKASAEVARPDPPKPATRNSTPPARTTRQQPKPKTPPKPKPKTEATPKAEPKPAPPKPAPVKVQSAPERAADPAPTPAPTVRTTNSTAGDAEKTTSTPTPSPERVEPVTEIARLTPRSESAPQPAVAPPSTPAVSKTDAVFRPPVVVERVEPVYSRKARKKGERGTIVINVLVSETGGIARVVVDQGMPGSELEAAAMNAVVRWKFKPATDGGKPVKAWTKAQFVFD